MRCFFHFRTNTLEKFWTTLFTPTLKDLNNTTSVFLKIVVGIE